MSGLISMGFGRVSIKFERIKAKGVRFETVGGKKVLRQKIFEKTVNPFNKNADGSVKSREEVRADVRAEAKAWEQEGRSE